MYVNNIEFFKIFNILNNIGKRKVKGTNRKINRNNTSGYVGVSPWNRYADGSIRFRAQYAGKVLGTGPAPKELSILVEKAKEKDPQYLA